MMMTDTSDYLARLDAALRDVPHGIAAEIRAGITEELSTLDPDAAEARIAQLGDPAVIAREAMDAGGFVPPAPAVAAAQAPAADQVSVPATRTRGFAIAAALTLSFGGFVIPFAGWVVGAVLVALSSLWRTWEKVVAIVVPLVLGGFSVLSSLTMWTTSGEATGGSMSGDGLPPEVPNPLLPTWYDVIWSSAWVLGLLVIPLSGLWLLWRMRGRSAS
ncbi:HAAS signaling domain-containing protein [Microbacterium sp. 22195]|uniref:HAAS signaling domain-containing protein n=1 Tax=Microbacterium sp. 22195 TaxID=3453891 RepID=UPI003F841EE6